MPKNSSNHGKHPKSSWTKLRYVIEFDYLLPNRPTSLNILADGLHMLTTNYMHQHADTRVRDVKAFLFKPPVK